MMKRYVVGLLLAVWSIEPVTAAGSDPCLAILQGGAFDSVDQFSDHELFIRLMRLKCQWQSSEKTDSTGIDIGGLGKADRNEASIDQSSMCKSEDFSLAERNVDHQKIRSASKVLVDGFLACLGRPGTFIGYAVGGNKNEFLLKLGYNSMGGGTARPFAVVKSISNAFAAGCRSADIPSKIYPTPLGIKTISCNRKNGAGVTLILNTDIGAIDGANTVTLPAITPPPKCDLKEDASPRRGGAITFEPSACQRHVRFATYGAFTKGCTGPSTEVVDVRFNNRQIGHWKTGNFSGTVSLDAEDGFDIAPGEAGQLKLVRGASVCSDPQGELGLKVWTSEKPPIALR